MIVSRLIPLFLLSLSTALAFDAVEDLEDIQDLEPRSKKPPKFQCPKGAHIFHIRGNGGTQQQGYGITLPLINTIKAAIPHSTNISLNYPKTTATFREANTIAVNREHELISEYVKKCPKTPLILTGYSEGAGITMNVVCGTSSRFFATTKPLNPKFKDHVIAVIAYSDEGRTPGAKFNRGGCKKAGKLERQNPAGCNPYADKIQAYCHNEDNFCCTGGNDPHEHYTYFKLNDEAVGKFVTKQFKDHKKAMGTA